MQLMSSGKELQIIGKAQVIDQIPKRFKELKFGIQSNQDIVNQGVAEISDKWLYDLDKDIRPVKRNGPLDKRLGTSDKVNCCETCQQKLADCVGHFGYVKLALPTFHIGYLKLTINILQNICKDCGRVLLGESERRTYLRELRRPGIDNLKRSQICKKINEQCRKTKLCPYCTAHNGQIKKTGLAKIFHDKYSNFNKLASAKKTTPLSKIAYEESFNEAKKNNPEVERHMKKAMEDLNPLRVYNLFKMITPSDCELLGLNPNEGRPEMFLWQYIPAPPVCIRPSVAQENATTEDDLTTKLAEIVHMNSLINEALSRGQPVQIIMEQWEFLQQQIAAYINSDAPGLQNTNPGKSIRGFVQRLKGKQGRFRGNLSGKRVDFSGRTVISPDPNLSVHQVAMPILVAKNLTYPELVNEGNIEILRRAVLNGCNKWPGANAIIKMRNGLKTQLKWSAAQPGGLEHAAQGLRIGDIVERHVRDNDVVLFNRQPSLHKLSIMAHSVKVMPWRTFRFNECVCSPYNADFDGDEMNIHVPQTEEARAEALSLMGVKYNLCTPKNGEPIIAATQDFISASYLLSSKENFFNRQTFTELCMYMLDAKEQLDLPPPAIVKPEALWTGKQVFSVLMRPNKSSPVRVNLDAKCRDYKAKVGRTPDMDPNDGWLVVRNSEVMCGRMDKSTVGSGKKDSIFYIILRDFGPDSAVTCMNRLAKLAARYLSNQGFSIGISDVWPGQKLRSQKVSMVSAAYAECDQLIQTFKAGKLQKAPGCNMEETLENAISGILSRVRQQAGEYCIETLNKWNTPLIMAKSGSKGSNINVAQMITLVGQQMISGARVADGFQDRTLPHFPKNARQPPSKGFVRNSFFTGLTPTEFLFHAISGREGLVDTAVKTAETGYMSRRLMKSLEDLSVRYDDTVRNSSAGIVQFQFGADKLDPVDMEGSAVPVNFDRTFIHAENTTWNNEHPGLTPYELRVLCDRLLMPERARLARRGLRQNEELSYEDQSDYGIDEHESARNFLDTITKYIDNFALRLAETRRKVGLPELTTVANPPRESHAKLNENKAKQAYVDRVAKISEDTLRKFVELCLTKYMKAKVEPGHAVGAVGAQSIGEPGTQMTLRTFHFAGVAGMSITQGVPRIKEIINASKNISTPVITCPLENPNEIVAARIVKGRIEKTYISDCVHFIEDLWSGECATLCLCVDTEGLSEMHLDITVSNIAEAICKNRKLKVLPEDVQCDKNFIYISIHENGAGGSGRGGQKSKVSIDEGGSDLLLRVNYLKRSIPMLAISGYPDTTRAIIQTSEDSKHTVLVEGYGLRACMTTEGVIGTKCSTNSVLEVNSVLGIEAARTTIAKEIGLVMGDMGIDPRHMQLLADVMTYKGEVLGITRFGLSKMRDSVLQLASFEKTADHLFEAAARMKSDKIEGVSECIIMGQTMNVGTGAFQVVRRLGLEDYDLKPKETHFEEAWKWDEAERRKIASRV